jgi:6,7-dimethyl-8-ribityllumazine synthase
MKEYKGSFQAQGLRIAIVISRFNELITRNLLEGALDALKRHGMDEAKISIAWVPGALEIPVAAMKFAKTGKFDAVICLGTVIRGATAHFDIVANQSAAGIMQASIQSGIPVIMGVLTTDTIEQALERAGSKSGNKGFDAAVSAIETINVLKEIK